MQRISVRALLAALALTLVPAAALAAGCRSHDVQAMSCAEGSVWDAESRSCVPNVSS